jgi:hypothetical protein
MNERIKDLMMEAGYAAPELAGRAQKLVELIVDECAAIVEGFELTYEVADGEYADYEASSVLKEHFGNN